LTSRPKSNADEEGPLERSFRACFGLSGAGEVVLSSRGLPGQGNGIRWIPQVARLLGVRAKNDPLTKVVQGHGVRLHPGERVVEIDDFLLPIEAVVATLLRRLVDDTDDGGDHATEAIMVVRGEPAPPFRLDLMTAARLANVAVQATVDPLLAGPTNCTDVAP